MITHLSLENFKCFNRKQGFDLSNLNIFTGFNGRGKSTIFQSLLMLSQSYERCRDIKYLYPNGIYVNLDRVSDLLNKESTNNDRPIKIGIKTTVADFKEVEMGFKPKSDWKAELCELVINKQDYFKTTSSLENSGKVVGDVQKTLSETYSPFSPILSSFYFISASRIGPSLFERTTEELSSNPVGSTGENRLNVLLSHSTHNGICCGSSCSPTLKEEVEKWSSYILDGLQFNLDDNACNVINLGMKNKESIEGWIKPVNMGFGYSYILSVIINALIAPNDSVLFVENPEAHLHPIAQARLMELLCKVAMNGVQVNIETHSEHIVTSARLYALETDKEIKQENISIYFFDKDFSIKHLTIDEYGQIPDWPEGFFDLQEKQLMRIMELGLLKK